MRRSILAVLSLLLIAADPLEGDKFLEKADEKFEQAAERTQQAFAKSMREAYETRLKTYRSILAAATKAGDFDRATAVKARIVQIETERDALDASNGAKSAAKIPEEATEFEGHHYQLVRSKAPWHVAKARCEKMGGHLAIASTPEEEEFLIDLCKPAQSHVWLGATDEEEEGKWRWIDGTPFDSKRAKFDNYAYSRFGGVEHQLACSPEEGGELVDADPGFRFAYICEWDK